MNKNDFNFAEAVKEVEKLRVDSSLEEDYQYPGGGIEKPISQNYKEIPVYESKISFIIDEQTLQEEPWANQSIFDIMEKDGLEYKELIYKLIKLSCLGYENEKQ